MLPSPELRGETLAEMEFDDPSRFRALCVEHLRREPNQTFRAADAVLAEVNARLSKLPEWKAATFTTRYFEVDREDLEESLVLRSEGDRVRAKMHEREIERVGTSTVHSFLAKGGWLNNNLTL